MFFLIAMLPFSADALNEKCYNACADYWDRFPFANFLPRLLLKYQSAGKKVLDIGSGTGRVAEWLKSEGFDVVCIDPSSEMVSRCQNKGLRTVQTTVQAYETEETFGTVLAILSLIHVPKKDFLSQIDKIHRWLEPNGLFVLTLLEGETEGVEEAASGYPRFFAKYTRAEVLSLLKTQFTQIDYKEVKSGCVYMTFFFQKKELN